MKSKGAFHGIFHIRKQNQKKKKKKCLTFLQRRCRLCHHRRELLESVFSSRNRPDPRRILHSEDFCDVAHSLGQNYNRYFFLSNWFFFNTRMLKIDSRVFCRFVLKATTWTINFFGHYVIWSYNQLTFEPKIFTNRNENLTNKIVFELLCKKTWEYHFLNKKSKYSKSVF